MFNVQLKSNIQAGMRRYKQAFGSQALQAAMLDAGKYAGTIAEGVVSEYPKATRKPLPKIYTRTRKDGKTYKSKFASKKQQGYVFALGVKGKIPYRRSGELGRSITSSADISGTAVIVRVGTNKPYAPKVIGDSPRPQSAYHRGNWKPMTSSLQRGMPLISSRFQERLRSNIERNLR